MGSYALLMLSLALLVAGRGAGAQGGAADCGALMPGCTSCTAVTASRRLRAAGSLDDSAAALAASFGAGYTQPAGFACSACSQAQGYKLNALGKRCGARHTFDHCV